MEKYHIFWGEKYIWVGGLLGIQKQFSVKSGEKNN